MMRRIMKKRCLSFLRRRFYPLTMFFVPRRSPKSLLLSPLNNPRKSFNANPRLKYADDESFFSSISIAVLGVDLLPSTIDQYVDDVVKQIVFVSLHRPFSLSLHSRCFLRYSRCSFVQTLLN